jgi:CHASE2 domain-containing sensor protein
MLPIEWYPEWWVQHPIIVSLGGPSRMLLPTLLHGALLTLELVAYNYFGEVGGVASRRGRSAFRIMIICHVLLVLLSFSALDNFFLYIYLPVPLTMLIVPLSVWATIEVRRANARKAVLEAAAAMPDDPAEPYGHSAEP